MDLYMGSVCICTYADVGNDVEGDVRFDSGGGVCDVFGDVGEDGGDEFCC